MGENRGGEVETHMVEGLTLGFIDCHPKGQTDWELNSSKGEREADIGFRGQSNTGDEYNIAGSRSSENLAFNDSSSQSSDQESGAIAETD